MSVITIELQDDLVERITALGVRLQKSQSALIQLSVREFVERHETEHIRWLETLEALDGVARGEVVDGEQVLEWLKGWGRTS